MGQRQCRESATSGPRVQCRNQRQQQAEAMLPQCAKTIARMLLEFPAPGSRDGARSEIHMSTLTVRS